MNEPSRIESLELRIAPASVSLTYTDVDGDLVKIIASKPGKVPPPLDLADLEFVDGNPDGQLKTLTLTDTGFDGAILTFKVTRMSGGDGLSHVGFIDATGVDLNKVTVKGDLAKIAAGDATTRNDPGLNLLQVRSMGTFGLATQGGAGDLNTIIFGTLGAIKVAKNFTDAFVQTTATPSSDAQIGSVSIGGDLTGGTGDNSGQIFSSGIMGDVRIGGNITGGTGPASGVINSGSTIGNIRVGGDVIGGSGDNSGRLSISGSMDNVIIAGDLVGGAGQGSGVVESRKIESVRIGGAIIGSAGFDSGSIRSNEELGDVHIGGSVVGGAGHQSGNIFSTGPIGDVRISGSLIGGSLTSDESLFNSGMIYSFGRIASVSISGSFVAGTDKGNGSLVRCGAIIAGDDLGPVKIAGNITGNSDNPALIIAGGQESKPDADFDTAIASVKVGGDVRFARILAGFQFNQSPLNADASIGTVSVAGDWAASSVVAGAQDGGATGFGTGDTLQTVGNTTLIAQIASIMIKGDVSGSLIGGDHFGFVAEQIDKLRIGTRTFDLTEGPGNDIDLPFHFTDDMRVLEVN